MSLTLVTGPTVEPLTLDEAKLQIQQGLEYDNKYIQGFLIPAVRERCEMATARALLTQTWQLKLNQFPGTDYLEIPKPPLQSITSIVYTDTAGNSQTWGSSNYLVQAPIGPRCARGRVALPFAGAWPVVLPQLGAITIQFVCGYGADPATVPALLKQAMLLDLGTFYANREGVVLGLRGTPEILPWGVPSVYASYHSYPTQRLAA